MPPLGRGVIGDRILPEEAPRRGSDTGGGGFYRAGRGKQAYLEANTTVSAVSNEKKQTKRRKFIGEFQPVQSN